ncbi:MAG: hypothetical protein PHU93_03170 [Candidatus Gracilibacteria bacterium]|nr:hypothetical protein [Candidatus Gracilibacteria bacterium]
MFLFRYNIVTFFEQMMNNNQIKIIREKLVLYRNVFIPKELLEKILMKFAPSYTITDLCRKKVIRPLKRGGDTYINTLSQEFQDPYQTAAKYFDGELYAFGGLGVYASYGYSTQVIEWYTVYNTQVSGKRIIGNAKYIFRKQRESFFYGITTEKNIFGKYQILSKERAFIQMLREGKIWKSLPKNIDREKLLKLAKQHASVAIYQKIQSLYS